MDKALARADATFQPGNDGDASNIASMLSTSSKEIGISLCVSIHIHDHVMTVSMTRR